MKMLLNGEWTAGTRQYTVCDPQDGSAVDEVPQAGKQEMVAAITAAVSAFPHARRLPAHRRAAALQKAAEWVAARQDEYARVIAREGIKTIREARKEASRAVMTLQLSADEARRLNGETLPFDQAPGSERRVGFFQRVPVGVIGAITPFNDPLNLVAHKIGPALAAGNCVIVKPHPQTPLSALMLAEAFQESDLPAGMLQVVTGEGTELGAVLVSDPRVRMISFTGGVRTGREVMKHVGLKKVAMELGSNCPVIVLADADLQAAVSANLSGAFWAAGQNCLHVQRLLVHADVYEDFKEQMVAGAQTYRLGPKLDESTDMGPLVSPAEAERVEGWVNEALAAGARLLCGGKRTGRAGFMPTLLEDVPADCLVAKEEVYGPVTVLIRVHSLSEAIERANAVDYGLQAGIFTRDVHSAFQAASELDFGGVMINESTDFRIDAMPFGGFKNSGLGREGVHFTVQEMTEPKLTCFSL